MNQKMLWVVVLILLSLLGSCSKKSTHPIQPTVYLMKDYFPLNVGDEWFWEVTILQDSIPEPFVDGDISLGEPFVDNNGNGIYDPGIDYFDITMDLNQNGRYDGPYDPWTPGIPYEDRNLNGEYDYPNGRYDEGEPFTDTDGNGIFNFILRFHTSELEGKIESLTHISHDSSIIFVRSASFAEPPEGFYYHSYDGFSNDTLGLRWHSRTDWRYCPPPYDDLISHGPLTIAKAKLRAGDSVTNVDTSYDYQGEISGIYTWISILEGIEDVDITGAILKDCLKFKTIASGWETSMERYNGTSYQWYAKNVGLVKSEGPKPEEHWLLKSAKINGRSYP
jgi:hypothetical protein